MKKLILPVFLITLLSGLSAQSKGQAWTKDSKHVKVTLGAFVPFYLGDYGSNSSERPWDVFQREDGQGTWRAVGLGEIMLESEFGVHQNVGVGFILGLGGGVGNHVDYAGSMNFSSGLFANYHFAHLLNLSDKMDLYAGLNVGAGFMLFKYKAVRYNIGMPPNANYESRLEQWKRSGLVFGGFQVGACYFITENMGLTAEVGFGKTVVSAGLVFKR